MSDTIQTIEAALSNIADGKIKDYLARVGNATTLLVLEYTPAYHDEDGDMIDERFALRMGGYGAGSEGLCDTHHELAVAARKVFARLSSTNALIGDQAANAPSVAIIG